ncbi:MAG: hypothetical protein LKK11_02075 [Acidaminococcus sp.]|nr:hypothetical protein [Acidaminococcus sp.]
MYILQCKAVALTRKKKAGAAGGGEGKKLSSPEKRAPLLSKPRGGLKEDPREAMLRIAKLIKKELRKLTAAILHFCYSVMLQMV